MWAMQIGGQYRPWPQDLPSPRNFFGEEEQRYSEKANFIFQQAAAYLLAHEYAHVILGHLDALLDPRMDAYTQIAMEKEADIWAFETAIGQDTDEGEWLSKPYAAVCAVLSSFCLLGCKPMLVGPQTHPALHHRLNHLLDSLNFTTEVRKVYFCTLSALALEQFFQHDHDVSEGPLFDTGEDWLQDVLDRIDGTLTGKKQVGQSRNHESG